MWYGKDWLYPSTGWNAWDAKGVGTEQNMSAHGKQENRHHALIHLWWGL